MNKSGKALHPMAMRTLRRAEKKGRRVSEPGGDAGGRPGIFFKLLPLYWNNREERVPREPLGPFRTDRGCTGCGRGAGCGWTWMGHASSLVEIDGVRVLLDPVWDERASPFSWMGPKRFFAAPLRLEDLPRIDAVLVVA